LHCDLFILYGGFLSLPDAVIEEVKMVVLCEEPRRGVTFSEVCWRAFSTRYPDEVVLRVAQVTGWWLEMEALVTHHSAVQRLLACFRDFCEELCELLPESGRLAAPIPKKQEEFRPLLLVLVLLYGEHWHRGSLLVELLMVGQLSERDARMRFVQGEEGKRRQYTCDWLLQSLVPVLLEGYERTSIVMDGVGGEKRVERMGASRL
jgi:hypothetical protein